jgi:hypothetical protein
VLERDINAMNGIACEVKILLADEGISMDQFREQAGFRPSRTDAPIDAAEIDAALAYLSVPRETLDARLQHRARFPAQVELLEQQVTRIFDNSPCIQEIWRSFDGRDRSVVLYIQTFEMDDVERIANILRENREYLKVSAPDSPIRLVSCAVASRANGHFYDGLIDWTGEHTKRIAARPLAPA